MRTTISPRGNPAAFLALVFAYAFFGASHAVSGDFSLAMTPPAPSPGAPVVVSLAGGLPDGATVSWSLSGAAFSNAGVAEDSVAAYRFTPDVPGGYVITADFYSSRGDLLGSSAMEIIIGGTAPSGGSAERPTLNEIYLEPIPNQPRIGQTATFTFRFGAAIPDGAEVKWDVSGGSYSHLSFSGPHNETCSLLPKEGPIYLRAVLHRADGRPMGEVSLGFIPVP